MKRSGACLILTLVFALALAGTASGMTIHVQVFERAENLTPLSGALVYANNTLAGKTGDEGTLEFFSSGSEVVPLRVEKYGYDPWEGELGTNTSELLVELRKARLTLALRLYDADTMDPLPGVTLTLARDGSEQTALSDASGSAEFKVEARGTYQVLAEAEHYQPVSMVVEAGTSDKEAQVMLFREDRFSLLIKDSDSGEPLAGARVFVEGQERGASDSKGVLTIPMPRGKVYLIRVSMEGYQDYNGRQIVDSEMAFLGIPLTKAPFTIFVSVYNEDRDPIEGAVVYVDNTTAGVTSQYGRAVLTNLTAGQYSLGVDHQGYVRASREISVAVQGEDLIFELPYKEMSVTVSAVEGSSVPVPGARISLNGEESGYTNATGRLPVRMRSNLSYILTAEKEGYRTGQIEHLITPGNSSIENGTPASLVIPMQRSFNWMSAGIAGIGIAVVIGAALVIVSRARARRHGRRGRL